MKIDTQSRTVTERAIIQVIVMISSSGFRFGARGNCESYLSTDLEPKHENKTACS